MAFSVGPIILFLFLSFSIQIHARESQFFSKTSRFATSPIDPASFPEDPARTTLPPLSPESRIGYGLYGQNRDQFPTSASTTNNNAVRHKSNANPSTLTNTEFENKEVNPNYNGVPSTFTYDTEFWRENYENKELNANHMPSTFSNTEYSNENKELNANHIPSSFASTEFSNENYENKELNNANSIPSGFSNGEVNQEKYPKYEKQYGMSDTRFMENGKYFYDVNAEEGSRYGKNYEPAKESYNGSGYQYRNNEVGEYRNGKEKQDINQEEYFP